MTVHTPQLWLPEGTIVELVWGENSTIDDNINGYRAIIMKPGRYPSLFIFADNQGKSLNSYITGSSVEKFEILDGKLNFSEVGGQRKNKLTDGMVHFGAYSFFKQRGLTKVKKISVDPWYFKDVFARLCEIMPKFEKVYHGK